MTRSRRSFLRLTAVGTVGFLPIVASCRKLVGQTPTGEAGEFLAAAEAGDLPEVRRLLAANPRLIQATDTLGRSAYALAHLEGHPDVGEHLVTNGYLSDVHEAALAQDWERFELLTQDDVTPIRADHPIGGDAMFAAATGGAGSDMWRLYAVDGQPNAMPRGDRGVSALQAGLRFRDLATAEMTAATLLANNANPDPASAIEDPPLHIAAARGSVELVEMLIRRGARVDRRDRRGRTAAQRAAAEGHVAVERMLIDHRTLPRTCTTSRTAYDGNGQLYDPPDISAIPLAERREFVGQSHRNIEYVQQAFAADSRMVHSVATTSEICVEACAHTGRLAIVDFLLEHGAPYSLPTAVVRNDLARVKQLLDEDPQRIHERGAHDFALLWYPLIGRTGTEMLELLLDRGGDVEQQHFLGTTALHWASMRGPIEVVDLLIDREADVNRRGRKFKAAGETPLECAMRQDQPEIARLLRQRGAEA